jgi:hypothetical protein
LRRPAKGQSGEFPRKNATGRIGQLDPLSRAVLC